MGNKYLDTKEGSLEQSILGLWQAAAGVKKEKLDPVGKEDGDIDNDGDKDSSDKYLMKRRKAIKKSMSKKEGNAFGMALKSAKEKGEKTFVVSGKKYNVEDVEEELSIQTAQQFKVASMKEALAKVWGLKEKKTEEGYMTAQKKKKKMETVKNTKTETGGKVAEVEIDPELKKK